MASLHAEIEAALAESGLGVPKRCTVGGEVRCDGPQSAVDLGRARLYAEQGARLDVALTRRPPPAKVDANAPPDTDPLDEARVTIVVTDGMPYTATGTGDAPSPCAQGADPTCIGTVLAARADEGFGVWLVGVLLPFKGNHYVERTVSPEYLAQTEAHVAELKFDARNLGVTFAASGPIRQDKSGSASFAYQGYKPLLVLVLSRDAALARTFVGNLKRKLEAAPLRPGKMQAGHAVATVELAPLDAPTLALTTVAVLSGAEQQKSGIPVAALAEFRLDGQQAIEGGVLTKFWCGGAGQGLYRVGYRRTGQGVLPSYLAAEQTLVVDPAAPAGVIAPPIVAGELGFRTGIKCAALPKGHTATKLALGTTLRLDPAGASEAWWASGPQGWSSVDKHTMPERVYGLEGLVRGMLERRAAKKSWWAMLTVHVQRD